MSATDHYPDGNPPTEEDLLATLSDVVEALRAAGLDFLLMGGIGTYSLGRPRVTQDIDVFIRPGDVERTWQALEQSGFEMAEHDPMWLVKGWKRGVLVDVIFRSSGAIYLDDAMLEHQRAGEYKGVRAPLISPEDLLVVKALVSSEANPQHWYDAMAIISRCELDWDYLLQRARQAGPRRVLSLLLFAESCDLVVPSTAIQALYDAVHPREPVS